MKTMAISNFKAHALNVLSKIAQSKEHVIITKRGKPLAEIIPFQQPENKTQPGKLAKTLVFEKDITAPLGEDM